MRRGGWWWPTATSAPPGWTYSPSTYLQRLPIIVLGAVGFVLARILTAYQLGHVDGVWEPFFAGDAAPTARSSSSPRTSPRPGRWRTAGSGR
ncbi:MULTISPECIES: hypothetical protein [unclassified Phenylobacterium]|uniref:hypothetical protein n=1 Tax=unclassified Phenylobacterium TaxID=2640670 RepID=UPI000B1D076D|nr:MULTISPECIES: hypothetical protein [unclassified Phenylobacterium]